MADDLIKTLDNAASEMMAKALAAEDLTLAQETFKILAGWVERKAKLQPPKADKGGEKFRQIRETFHGGQRTPRSRGNGSAEAQGEPADGSSGHA